jgi:hypothetical protein
VQYTMVEYAWITWDLPGTVEIVLSCSSSVK